MIVIEKDKAVEAIGEVHPLDYNARATKARIEKLPTIEIVRCRDCRHWDASKNCGYCDIWDHYISNDDFYCGCGEGRCENDERGSS